jgi:amino acid permease
MASIAYGLATRKAWSRHLVMAIFVLIIVYASALGALNVLRHTIMWRAIVNASLFGCASAWYFYFKPNVAEYFRKFGRAIDSVTAEYFPVFPIALLKPECEMQRPEEINDNAHAVFHFRVPACGQSGACR